MDPTEGELQTITNLAEARAWCGVEGPLADALHAALGQPARVREIALIPRPTWDRVVAGLQIQDGGDPRPPLRVLTPVEEARLESFRRVCCLRSGRPIDLPGDPAAAAPAVAPAPFPAAGGAPAPAPGGPQARKLKLSAVLDPTLDAEIQPLGDAEVTGMYERYRNRYGDFPSVDADVSRDQLAALSQVLAAHAVPYADFSIFGPHGQRLLRRQTFQSYSLNVSTGEWAKKEQPGPGSFYEWYKAWRCYRTALLLLEAAEAERLDAYAEHIRGFVTQFGEEAWPFIFRQPLERRGHTRAHAPCTPRGCALSTYFWNIWTGCRTDPNNFFSQLKTDWNPPRKVGPIPLRQSPNGFSCPRCTTTGQERTLDTAPELPEPGSWPCTTLSCGEFSCSADGGRMCSYITSKMPQSRNWTDWH